MLKRVLVSVAALSLTVSPVLAQSRAPAAAPEPAAESVEGSEMYRGGIILPLLGVLALTLVVLALTVAFPPLVTWLPGLVIGR